MTKPLHIFIEYKIKEQSVEAYERAMKERILRELPLHGASNIQWFAAHDQPCLYVEMFEVPASSYYHALQELRQSENAPVFGEICQYVAGGSQKIHCWAFQRKE